MELQFLRAEWLCGDVFAFYFNKPAQLTWQSGQSARFTIHTIMGPAEHRFTIASAESENVVCITTKISDSDYKQALATLKPGDTIFCAAIEGAFTPAPQKPFNGIAIGLGITPFRALLPTDPTGTMLYASPGEHVYKPQFNAWHGARAGNTIRYVGGRLTHEHIVGMTSVWAANDSPIYVAGPEAAVRKVADMIHALNVRRKIITDMFTGVVAH